MDTFTITDGSYAAHMTSVEVTMLDDGRERAVFEWTLEGCDVRLSTTLEVKNAQGERNHASMALAKGWAVDWKTDELAWFKDNLETCKRYRVKVSVINGQANWVCALKEWDKVDAVPQSESAHHGTTNTSQTSVCIKLVVDPAKFAEVPERIELNFESAKAIFDLVTEGTAKLDADYVWIRLAAKIGPMQVDFGEAEWQQMIDKIRQLKSWEGFVEV